MVFSTACFAAARAAGEVSSKVMSMADADPGWPVSSQTSGRARNTSGF